MKRSATYLIGCFAALTAAFATATAQAPQAGADPYASFAEDVYMDMEFEPNLATPDVPERARPALRKHVRAEAQKYKNQFQVDLMRDGEVMIFSIPTDDLFLPNDTMLSKYSDRILPKVLPLLNDPYRYKIVVTMNTDNTGSDIYRENLSQARLNSVYDWFIDKIESGVVSEDLIIIPFSMASEDALEENDTRAHRRLNRRLDIYFVPGPKLIQAADSGQL